MIEADLKKKLDGLMSQINKDHGAESISVFGNNFSLVKWVPLDSFYLTELIGKGIPRGRIIEVFGKESSGKSTLSQAICGQVQKYYFEDKKRYGVAAYVDVEHAFDPNHAKDVGMVVEDTLFSQPDSGEQALDVTEALVSSGLVDIIVVDSVAALVPKSEIEGEMGDQQMAAQARLMGKAMRKLQSLMKPDGPTVIFINQVRDKFGGMGHGEQLCITEDSVVDIYEF